MRTWLSRLKQTGVSTGDDPRLLPVVHRITAWLFGVSVAATAPKGLREPQAVMTSGTVKQAGTNDLDPRLSPNGAKIIFTNVSNTGTGECAIITVDFDGQAGQNRTVLIKGGEMPYWR